MKQFSKCFNVLNLLYANFVPFCFENYTLSQGKWTLGMNEYVISFLYGNLTIRFGHLCF